MPYQEVAAARTDRSRTYQDSENPRHKVWAGGLAKIHFRDEAEGWVAVDFRPEHVTAGGNDVWRITQSGWHYALGQPNDKATDGWIGFGGRRGEHWLKFRLARVGYLHGPTGPVGGWQDLGGAPTYNRQNLSHIPHAATIGPNDDEIYVSASAEWRDLWPALPAGELSLRWSLDGYRLKEDVIINQAAREWIAANRPPSTPAAETLFGFVFQFDWSDIPRVVRQGVLQDRDADWEAGGDNVELRNAADELLAFLPLGYVYVEDAEGNREQAELTRRFWRDPDGNHYLLVGARVPDIAGLPAGDLHFDPTISESIGADADDGYAIYKIGTGWSIFNSEDTPAYIGCLSTQSGWLYNWFMRFTGISGLSGATIDTAYFSVYGAASSGGTVQTEIYAADAEIPSAPTDASEYGAVSLTSASQAWDGFSLNSSDYNDSPSIVSIIQELADSYDPSAIMIMWKDDTGTDSNNYASAHVYSSYDSDNPPQLYIEYTAGGGTDNLTPNDLATGAPTLDTPALGQEHALAATDLTGGTPALDTPTLGQEHALTADDLATDAPTLSTPALGVIHNLTPNDLTAGAPTLDTPAIGQTHALTADDLSTAPALDTPALGQAHALTADDLAAGAPELDTPAVGQAHALTADDLAAGSPALDTPAIGQAHVLTGDDLATDAPALDTPAIGQVHALTADDLATGAPTLGTPAISGGDVDALTPDDLATGAPALTSPALGQVHALAGDDLTVSAPQLDAPALGQIHGLTADDLTAGTPTLGTPAAGIVHILVADSLTASAPLLDTPSIGQIHALAATGVTTAPVLDTPALGQVHGLAATDLTTGAPTLGTPTLQGAVAVGMVTATFTAKRATATITAKRATATITAKRPEATFTTSED